MCIKWHNDMYFGSIQPVSRARPCWRWPIARDRRSFGPWDNTRLIHSTEPKTLQHCNAIKNQTLNTVTKTQCTFHCKSCTVFCWLYFAHCTGSRSICIGALGCIPWMSLWAVHYSLWRAVQSERCSICDAVQYSKASTMHCSKCSAMQCSAMR